MGLRVLYKHTKKKTRAGEGSEADRLVAFERVCLEVGAYQSQWFSGHTNSAFSDLKKKPIVSVNVFLIFNLG